MIKLIAYLIIAFILMAWVTKAWGVGMSAEVPLTKDNCLTTCVQKCK